MSRVLLVDDDETIAELVEVGLVAHGYEVVKAGNGVEALAAYARQRPDLVITDLVMPEKEGWTLIGELRRRDPQLRILAMTGGGLDTPRTYLKLAEQVGATGTLRKPFTLDELLAAIGRLDEPKRVEPPIAFRPRERRRQTGSESNGSAQETG